MRLEPRAIPFPGRSTNPPFFNKGLCIRVLIIDGMGALALAHLLNQRIPAGVEVQGVDVGYYTTSNGWSQKAYTLRSFQHEAVTREGIDILRVKAAYGFGLIGSWPRRHYMPGATHHTHRAGVRCRRLLFPIYRPYEHTRNFFLSASHHAGLMLPMAPSHLGGSVSAGGQWSVYP